MNLRLSGEMRKSSDYRSPIVDGKLFAKSSKSSSHLLFFRRMKYLERSR